MVFESNVSTLRGVVPILYVFGLSALAGRHKAFARACKALVQPSLCSVEAASQPMGRQRPQSGKNGITLE